MALCRAGKVKRQTPKVPWNRPSVKKKKTGRAKHRNRYQKFVNIENQKEKVFRAFVDELQPYNHHKTPPIEDDDEYERLKTWIITSNNTLVPITILDIEPDLKFDKEQIIQILLKEDEIRKSDNVQIIYSTLYEDSMIL